MKAGTTALLGVGSVAALLLLAHTASATPTAVGDDVRLFDVVTIPVRNFPALALPDLLTADLRDPQGSSIVLQVLAVAPDGKLSGTILAGANRKGQMEKITPIGVDPQIANVPRSAVAGILKRGRALTDDNNELERGTFA